MIVDYMKRNVMHTIVGMLVLVCILFLYTNFLYNVLLYSSCVLVLTHSSTIFCIIIIYKNPNSVTNYNSAYFPIPIFTSD